MKYFLLFSTFFFLPMFRDSILNAQTDSTFVGKWTCTVVADESSRSSYLDLKSDSTFVSGSDSSFKDLSKQMATGMWKINSKGEIILIPKDTTLETHYFEHVDHWKFHYCLNERHGQTYPVAVMEMQFDIYLEKIIPKAKRKRGR